jgi:hypothetical protein
MLNERNSLQMFVHGLERRTGRKRIGRRLDLRPQSGVAVLLENLKLGT